MLAGHADDEVGPASSSGVSRRLRWAGDVEAPGGHDLDGRRRWPAAVADQAGRADVASTPRLEALAEDGLGHGRSADVAGAHDEDLDGRIVVIAVRPPHDRRRRPGRSHRPATAGRPSYLRRHRWPTARSTRAHPCSSAPASSTNRVDRGADVLEPVDLMAEALRSAEADTGAPACCAAGRLRPGRCASSRGATATPARSWPSGSAPPPRHTALHGHGRQLRPDGREPSRRRHPGRSSRRRARHRRRGLAHAAPTPAPAATRGLDDAARGHPTRRCILGEHDPQLSSAGRDRAGRLHAGAGLPDVRDRAAGRRGPHPRRAAPARRRAVVALQRGRGRRTRTRGSSGPTRPTRSPPPRRTTA